MLIKAFTPLVASLGADPVVLLAANLRQRIELEESREKTLRRVLCVLRRLAAPACKCIERVPVSAAKLLQRFPGASRIVAPGIQHLRPLGHVKNIREAWPTLARRWGNARSEASVSDAPGKCYLAGRILAPRGAPSFCLTLRGLFSLL
jgi:hypothetical protein